MLNRCRLATLKSRDDQVANVLKKTEQALVSKRNDAGLIQNCITQALLQAMEAEVTIRCLPDQVDLVQSLLNNAAATYQQMTQQQVNIELDRKNFLQESKIGGIVLITKRGRLTIDNTLVARLNLISQQLLPEIRNTLFGENKNRKFKDWESLGQTQRALFVYTAQVIIRSSFSWVYNCVFMLHIHLFSAHTHTYIFFTFRV